MRALLLGVICWFRKAHTRRGRVRLVGGDAQHTGTVQYYIDCAVCGEELG